MVNLVDDQDSNSTYQDPIEKPNLDANQKLSINEPDVLWSYDTKDPTVGGVATEFTKPKDV